MIHNIAGFCWKILTSQIVFDLAIITVFTVIIFIIYLFISQLLNKGE
uniref:Uncharacterized protein n=1 Tax=viral metagenome TaxID=1070528 RepID=A0A6M3JLI7_9ZZZZ